MSFEINYDIRPYLPDIFIKQNIYNSCDSLNNNNNINANDVIFIINIDRPISSIYNDPSYILYGIKNPLYENDYEFPSLNYYLNNTNNQHPYLVTIKTNELTSNLKSILSSIGFNCTKINENQFIFQELEIYESKISQGKILYFYFNLIEYIGNNVNYNNYVTSINYNSKIHNVMIYPYYNNINIIYTPININKNISVYNSKNTEKSIDKIDFGEREIIKYYEKIDYKYFENIKYTMDTKTNIETLKNYSLNIKNYVDYIEKTNIKNSININLNEISKIYYNTTDYENKYYDTYTNNYLNNNHINNNKLYSNQANRYSYSADKKTANIKMKNIVFKEYSLFYLNNNNNTLSYQQTVNYYINSYYDINDTTLNQLVKLNFYLYKLFVLINPKIIDQTYLLNNVNTNIYPLYPDTNTFNFGIDKEKLQLYLQGDLKHTKLYYIDKYKIIYEFIDDIIKFSYIIILNVSFYNSDYINILESKIKNNYAFINFTILEDTISLLPTVSNYKNIIKIENSMINYNIPESNYYYYYLDYKDLTNYNLSKYLNFINFYFLLPNIFINLQTPQNKYYNNVLNVFKTKLNNYIQNFVNIDSYYNNYNVQDNIKKYINISTLYDENIIIKQDTIKYIEYFDYFPKISSIYETIDENYIGKYSQILLYPYNNINISSFEAIVSGKYIKFNYINYNSFLYPTIINEDFVKSIKNIDQIINYYFSLFILLPLNYNPDDETKILFKNNNNTNNYAMGIGGNYSQMYLVLTNENGVPYSFYGDNNNGIIYGIKLFNYNNFISDNIKLSLIPNLYMNNYLNLSEFIILIEFFKIYTDTNNMLWDINNSYLKLHNFTHLKEIVKYDFIRFNTNINVELLQIQYDKFNYKTLQILYENKVQLNNMRYDIKILIYLSNLFKIIKLLQKIYSYCEIVKNNKMLYDYENDYLINIIKYNTGQISDLLEINYYLCITSGTFDTEIYQQITQIYKIDINNTIQEINEYQIYSNYIITYSIKKMNSIINSINPIAYDKSSLYYSIYHKILQLISIEEINFYIGEEIINDIDNFINTTNILILNFEPQKKILLFEQINACLKLIAFNSTKIDELYNLAKLMGNKDINDLLPLNLDFIVVKNDYIYNTTSYEISTNVPRFKIIDFLNNTIELIDKLSISLNNPSSYNMYQKAILEGIIIYIENTIIYFKDIINEIVGIYTFMRIDMNTGINIYLSEQIGIFYNLLNKFKNNYDSFFKILYQNKINKFYEYDNLKISFDNLFYSCEEFLFYICLKNNFINENMFLYSNVFVNEDLYKIVKLDTFYDFMIKTLNSIDDLIIVKNPQLSIIYLEKIKSFENKFLLPLKNITIQTIDLMIAELKTGIPSQIEIQYGSYYILPYQDLLLFKGIFSWASFNFNQNVIDVINMVNMLNITIFETYYTNPEITDFYKQSLNYTYLSTPYENINVNNTTLEI